MRLLLVGAWIALMGAGLLVVHVRTVRDAAASATWPTADGVMLKSEVVRRVQRHRSTTVLYRADLLYRYVVGGRTYESNRIAIGHSTDYGDPAMAQGEVGQYPVGRRVRVYYHPQDPERSALVAGLRVAGAGRWLALWGAVLLVGLGLMLAGARAIRRRGGWAGLVDRTFGGGP